VFAVLIVSRDGGESDDLDPGVVVPDASTFENGLGRVAYKLDVSIGEIFGDRSVVSAPAYPDATDTAGVSGYSELTYDRRPWVEGSVCFEHLEHDSVDKRTL